MTRLTAAALAVALLATACSGGDDDAATVTTTTPITDDTVDTVATTAPTTAPTTAVPTTVPATTSTAGTTEPDDPATTTEPTATTEPDDDADRQAVLDAVVESWRVFNEAKLDPTNDDKVAALSEVTGGELLVNSIEVIARYRAENKRSVTNPDVPAAIVLYPDTLQVDQEAGTAQVDYCRIGSNILVEIGGNADGSDLVLDDTVNTYVERSLLVLEEGRWLDTGGIDLEYFEGATSCPDRG